MLPGYPAARVTIHTEPVKAVPDMSVAQQVQALAANREAIQCNSTRSGLLVSVDGPNGVGKTKVVETLVAKLRKRGIDALATTQPSPSFLGQVVRAESETCRGVALAHLVAGDRLQQQHEEIVPALESGRVVLLDRYLPSSLVLQVLDGVPAHKVWVFNEDVRPADLAVILRADPDRIRERLRLREGGPASRFERDPASTHRELDLFDHAATDLAEHGWPVTVFDTSVLWPYQVANQIADLIEHKLTGTVMTTAPKGISA